MTTRKGEEVSSPPPRPPSRRQIPSSAQPCPADCRVTLQERGTRCRSAGKTCSAVFSGWTLLPPTTPPASGAAPPYLGREEQSSTRLPHSCCPPRLTQPLRLHCCPAGRTCSTFPRPLLRPAFQSPFNSGSCVKDT